jgi:predicted DNA-binding protein YlxM (UPF0122 family)
MEENTLQLVNQLNNLTMDQEIMVLQHLFKKYNLKTISDHSKDNSISRQAVYNQIEKGHIMNIKIGNQTFVS